MCKEAGGVSQKHNAEMLVPTIKRGAKNGHVLCEQPLKCCALKLERCTGAGDLRS